jgi:hypothetical protein
MKKSSTPVWISVLLRTAVVVLVAGGALSGCGVGAEQAQPAAEAQSTPEDLGDVEQAVTCGPTEYCKWDPTYRCYRSRHMCYFGASKKYVYFGTCKYSLAACT